MNLNVNNLSRMDPTMCEAMRNISAEEQEGKLSIRRGDIWFVRSGIEEPQGHEQKNGRPAIVVSNDKGNEFSPTVEVVFLTSKMTKKWIPTHVNLMGKTPSVALCEQITTVDRRRMDNYIRRCTADEMQQIEAAIQISLGMRKILSDETFTGNKYQRLAARTIRANATQTEKTYHALHGMVGEIGELHSIYQKKYQGHAMQEEHMKKELGDLLWFIAEYCTAHGWNLEEIMQMNIDKLKARYPEGFNEEQSLHRKAGDI